MSERSSFFGYTADVPQKIGDFLSIQLKDWLKAHAQADTLTRIKILYIGKNFQELFLSDFLEKAITMLPTKVSIDIVTLVSGSSAEIAEHHYFERKDLLNTFTLSHPRLHFETTDANLKVDIESDIGNQLEKTSLAHYFTKNSGGFDMIFCAFEWHILMNWRSSLTYVLAHLANNGVFLFGEETGDAAFLDGNFRDNDRAIGTLDSSTEAADQADRQFFKTYFQQFDQLRNKHYFWKPEISFSNYRELRNQVEFFFRKLIDRDSRYPFKDEDLKAVEITQDDAAKRQILRGNFQNTFQYEWDFQRECQTDGILARQAFTYFRTGLTKEVYEKIQGDALRFTEEKLGRKVTEVKPIVIEKSLQLYLALGFDRERFHYSSQRQWSYDALIKDVQQISDNDTAMFTQKALDLLLSHDIFIPDWTEYCAIFSWHQRDNLWSFPVHILHNDKLSNKTSNQTILQTFRRLAETHQLSFRQNKPDIEPMLSFIFQKMCTKVPLIFQHFEDDAPDGPLSMNAQNKRIRPTKDWLIGLGFKEVAMEGNRWLLVKPRYDRKNNLEKITFAFNTAFVKPLLDWSIKSYKPSGDRVGVENDIKKWANEHIIPHQLAKGVATRYSIVDAPTTVGEDKRLFFDKLIDLAEKEAPQIPILPNYGFPAFNSTAERMLTQICNMENAVAQFQYVLAATVRFQLSRTNYQLCFYPTSAVEEKADKQGKKLDSKPSSEGLGGIILSEKLYQPKSRLKLNYVHLFKARDKALLEACNQIFYKVGIADYVKLDFRIFAQQSAVSAIISRNGSHSIGSHVIPGLLNSRQQEDLSETIKQDGIFFKYLQDRFEFITQLSNPTLPKWTITTWFARDLLKRFMEQRQLVNNLAQAERLRAYHFFPELDWDDLRKKPDNKRAETFAHGMLGCDDEGYFLKKILPDPNSNTPIIRLNWKNTKNTPSEKSIETKRQAQVLEKLIKAERQVRVLGRFETKDATILLQDARLIESKILFKFRIRRYYSCNEEGQIIITHTSQYLKNKSFVDVTCMGSWADIRAKADKDSNKVWLFGVVASRKDFELQLVKDNENLVIKLDETDPNTEILMKKNFKINDLGKVRAGTRVLIEASLDPDNTQDNFAKAVLRERTETIHVLHPSEKFANSKTLKNDVLVSIPGGIVGFQAFYSILENIIRNAAKHKWAIKGDDWRSGRNLVVNVEIEDEDYSEAYICRVWTSADQFDWDIDAPAGSERKKDFPNTDKNSLTQKIRGYLTEPIVKEGGQVSKEHIGISEMKICTAFLAGSDWINTPSVFSDPHAILLDYKIKRKDTKGYVRASVQWDTEGGKLIPHLGYRFKILKPKEILIFGDANDAVLTTFSDQNNQALKSVECVEHAESESREKDYRLDFECCALVQPIGKNRENLPEKCLLYAIFGIFEPHTPEITPTESKRNVEKAVMQSIIKYPQRLFVVYDVATDIGKTIEAAFDNRHKLDRTQPDEAFKAYLFSRIVFIKRRNNLDTNSLDFETMIQAPTAVTEGLSSEQILKLRFYERWLQFIEDPSQKFDIDLKLHALVKPSESDKNTVSTLPMVLRMPKDADEKNPQDVVKNFRQSVGIQRIKSNGALVKHLQFHHHGNNTEGSNIFFTEVLSGAKSSFSTFINMAQMPMYEQFKLCYQMHEAAHSFVLVLDERVMAFVRGNKDRYIHFENANILVPIFCGVSGDTPFTHQNDEDTLKGLDKHFREIIVPNTEGGTRASAKKLTLRFYQPDKKISFAQQQKEAKNAQNMPKLPKKGRVTCVIIHQALLEKFAGQGPEASSNFVRKLKTEIGIPSVIVTSGRGKNDYTAATAKFLAFSDISGVIMQEQPEKWLLTRIISESVH